MRLAVFIICLAALLMLGSPALAARHAPDPRCLTTAAPTAPYTNPVTGQPELTLGGQIKCAHRAPINLRVCPQVAATSTGPWSFVRSDDGYGTCIDSGWSRQTLTYISRTFGCTGYIRVYVAGWYRSHQRTISAVALGSPSACPGP